MLTAVPDTNLFLQCKLLEQLNWGTMFPDHHEICLVIPRVVIAQLDRLKNDGNLRRAKRARVTAARFREMLRATEQCLSIRDTGPTVTMRFAPRSRLSQEDFPDLDLTIDDDRLVAEALRLAQTGTQVVIVTGDVGVELTAKEVGLRAEPIPEDWWLLPEANTAEKELRRLKKAAHREPALTMLFSDQLGNEIRENLSHTTLRMSPLDNAARKRVVEQIRANHPISHIVSQRRDPVFGRLSSPILDPAAISNYQIVEYERDYRDWSRGLSDWVNGLPDCVLMRSHIFGLMLEVANSGGGPAQELRLDLEVSKGFVFVEDELLEISVSPPKAPEPPRRTELHFMGSHGADSFLDRLADLREERDPFEFYFRERPERDGGSPAISITCESLHPGRSVSIIVGIAVEESAQAGALSYRLSARNLANPVDKVLPFRVDEQPIDAAKEDERLKLILDPSVYEALR